jgi:hypothetical protein
MSILLLFLMAQALPAAVGPVPVGSLPGGGSLVDSDPGSGQQWGRPGGRRLTFSGFDLPLFTLLEWGPVGPTSVGIAFDGVITPGTQEVLVFSLANSNLSGGVAIWTGATTVSHNGFTTGIGTRFRLTVTDASSNPVILTPDGVTGLPRVDVLTVPGTFTARLEMLAKLGTAPTGSFSPALNLFDSLNTPSGGTDLAQTSLSHGFFFESPTVLSLVEHDVNMQGRADLLAGQLGRHNLDALGYLMGLGVDHVAISTKIMELRQLIDLLATGNDVDAVRRSFEEFQQVLLQFLWGVEFDEATGEPIMESITQISSLARTKLDLQVISPPQGKNPFVTNMLVLATENGEMVNATIDFVAAIPADPNTPHTPVMFEATDIKPGLIRLNFSLIGPASSAKMFLILAKHSDHEFRDDVHHGAILATETPSGGK